MGDPRKRPAGEISQSIPQERPHAIQPTNDNGNDDDGGDEVVFTTSRVEADSPLNLDIGLIDNRDHSKDGAPDTRSMNEHSTNQSCPSTNCVRAKPVRTQFDPKKRKSPAVSISVPVKKIRVDDSTSLAQFLGSRELPAEVWQRIFSFLPPKMLGRLLSVDKHFNSVLDPLSHYTCNTRLSPVASSLLNLKPNAIWQLSRRRFWPTMPTPLRDHTELQMWQLACRTECQFHDIADQTTSPTCDSSSSENEHTSSRPIWSYALRICRSCLVDKTVKEVDLLLSSIPSFLIPALPFIFIDDEIRVISSAMLQTGHPATKVPVTKLFLSSHVAAIQEEFALAKAMGEAAAGEWTKGLDGRGKTHRADSLRWEKFEISGGLNRMRQRLYHDNTRVCGKGSEAIKAPKPLGIRSSVRKKEEPQALLRNPDLSDFPLATPIHSLTRPPESSCAQYILGHHILPQADIPRGKTREEAEEMKAARRAEIERRAAELEPPLPAHILAFCPSFQAAIQITSPLDDMAWNLLKSRLIAQRGDVGQEKHEEHETSDHFEITSWRSDNLRTSQKLRLETKQQVDKTWDDAQAPLRARISILADQIIRDNWENGRRVNKESSLQFAAEVLLLVRRRFYAEIEKDDAAVRAAGQQPICEVLNSPYTRKLTLENMKWLFEAKVKPLTEIYGKELFYCNGCDFNTKPFGLEGVVQHYAAKHTSRLSLGSVVVHWRAEWPEVPPFHPKPHDLKHQRAGLRRHKSNGILSIVPYGPREQLFHQDGTILKHEQSLQHSQYDAVPFQPLYGEIAPLSGCANPFQRQTPQYLNNSPFIGATYHEPAEAIHDVDLYTSVQPTNVNAYQSHSSITYQNHLAQDVQSSYIPSPVIDHTKLEDITRNSRELWFSMAPIKELPGPIRIFIVIYHMAARFRARFLEEPSLSSFIDGLSNKKEMRPVRNLNGLRCKACYLGLGTTNVAVQDKESYSLPQLVKHFHQRHIEQQYAIGAPVINWCTDMVYLPDLNVLSNLDSLRTVDNRRRSLIYSALSGATSGDLRLHDIRSPTTQLIDNKTPDYGSYSNAIYPPNQQALIHKPYSQHAETIQDPSQHDSETHNADECMSQAARMIQCSGIHNDLGTKIRPSILGVGRVSTREPPEDTTATHRTGTGTKVSSIRKTPSPVELTRGDDRETIENDEDDGFDLIAGLESQLNRQASSTGLDT
ncbi:hypothetical protein F5Y10DRAFT_235600 [Nemania abortiva]|nr:hypothetical protein F5Y10DRAFT_235600 [Nemania abortiva]